MSIDIEQSLKDRFSQPLPDNYLRRIIFWQDPEGEFSDLVDGISIDNVKVLKLTGTNNFEAKLILSEKDTDSHYLVYNPVSYSDIKENWLLDIELYSEEFRADLLSIRMQELNIPSTAQMRTAIKSYSKFFDNKDRVAKLKSLKTNYVTSSQLHIDVLSILSGAGSISAAGVITAVLTAGLNDEENTALENIKKFGREEIFWELVNRYTGFVKTDENGLIDLAKHILITTLSVTMKASLLHGLEGLISEPHQQLCYSLINEWMHSENDDDLYEIGRTVENNLYLTKRFDSFEVTDLLNSECFPCINECILRRYMSEISEDIIKADDIVATVEKRRTLKWYKRVRYYYDGLLNVAYMQQFHQDNIKGFHIAKYQDMWKEYCGNYCKMDHFYRAFYSAFGKSLRESSTVLEDIYKGVADYVEKLYKNWYLSNLGSQWTNLIEDEIKSDTHLTGIPQQDNFYSLYVKPIVTSGSRVFVIISDALRYEVGVDLTNHLIREMKGSARLSSMQSIYPTATKYGMAALLPHKVISMTDDMKVLCDGLSTEDTESRDKVLKQVNAGNVAVTYKKLLSMKQAERRDMISDAQTVYIYHNSIDAVGEKQLTEDQVFDACENAITEIKNLVRIIINDLNGTNIIITADHGFIYSNKPLEEIDKAEKSYIAGNILELDRRYVITDSECTAEHMLEVPLTHLESNCRSFTPLDYIRMKKQGGGQNYVHGGVSLQECVLPVIEYKNMRASSKNYVDVKKAEIQLVSQSRKISNSIFSLDFYQKDIVGGKITDATYDIYFSDASGKIISDTQRIIADKTSNNGSERMFRIRFTLKSMDYKKTDTYYMNVVEKGTTNAIDRVEFSIDIAFANDFDF